MSKSISWSSKHVDMPALDYDRLGRWIEAVAQAHDRTVGELAYLFVDDEEILRVNREFLSHDYYTDIITFDYSRRRLVRGDMVISLDTVRTNADAFADRDYDTELLRVIIHGLLHLCGINDKGPGEREIMEQHENEALKLLEDIH